MDRLNLKLVGIDSKKEEPETTSEAEVEKAVSSFREEVNSILTRRQELLEEGIRKWILFSAEVIGNTRLMLDECPYPLTPQDRQHVISWLRGHDFVVRTPKLKWGRTVIDLSRRDEPKTEKEQEGVDS
jgi:hypothetical protein